MSQSARFLGWAFAAGDLLCDLDSAGRIHGAVGVPGLLGALNEADLNGQTLAACLADGEGREVESLLSGFGAGQRRGPVYLRTKAGTAISLSLFRLPQRPDWISCSIRPADAVSAGRDELVQREAWDANAASILKSAAEAGVSINMDLVELAGFEASLAAMPHHQAQERRRQVASMLNGRSAGGAGATELAPDRFVLLASDVPPPENLERDLAPIVGPDVSARTTRLALAAESPAQNIRALRYALDRFIEDGGQAAQAGFQGAIRRTLEDSARFKAIVAAKAFNMAYQPVVSLNGGGLHHFEALARFEVDGSPADTIRLAEELDMMTAFDLVVAEMVFETLVADKDVSAAVNVSARSIRTPGFVDRFLAITASDEAVRGRMLVELTESASLGDLTEANRAIQTLRGAGHGVCLDDFGAGQASLEYVRDLEVDFLKIDGRYIKDLIEQPRGVAVIRHLVALCRELGVPTIAEMVETPAVDRLLRELGVDLGQGWLYGKPQPDTAWMTAQPVSARRQGVVEQWG